jgi:hypothetical protein
LIRELGEELDLRADDDCAVAAKPLARLEYTAWSASARAQTQYTMELFEVELSGAARRKIEADPQNRWIGEAEIAHERADDGRPVSATMQRFLEALRARPS